MSTRKNLYRFLLVVLLVALLAVPLVGAVAGATAAHGSQVAYAVTADDSGGGPYTDGECPDPGGSQGGGC